MEHFSFANEGSHYAIFCRSEKTRYGFRHLATLYRDHHEIGRTKACYYNRTWECYEFQSVIDRLLDAHFSGKVAERLKKKAENEARGVIDKSFSMVAAVAKLGGVLCDNVVDRNKWKKRMLSTIHGVDFPADFDSLPEDEKQKRLDKALEAVSPKQEVSA